MAEQQKITRNELEAKLVAHAWQDEAFKQELFSNPKAAIEREIGHKVSESTDIAILHLKQPSSNTNIILVPLQALLMD